MTCQLKMLKAAPSVLFTAISMTRESFAIQTEYGNLIVLTHATWYIYLFFASLISLFTVGSSVLVWDSPTGEAITTV